MTAFPHLPSGSPSYPVLYIDYMPHGKELGDSIPNILSCAIQYSLHHQSKRDFVTNIILMKNDGRREALSPLPSLQQLTNGNKLDGAQRAI
ncbi:hypothetical protein [Microcoleus sp. CZ3-B4]|uniref:hypothetical protein n=1 Tax=Microcoleus sp. CZ3-B4 TaxID=2818733 RepID=UPI002FD08E2D